MNIPIFSSHLFWDTDVGQIDWQGQSEAVLVRVLNRGSLEDVMAAERFYGIEAIKALLPNQSLSPEGQRLAKAIISALEYDGRFA